MGFTNLTHLSICLSGILFICLFPLYLSLRVGSLLNVNIHMMRDFIVHFAHEKDKHPEK